MTETPSPPPEPGAASAVAPEDGQTAGQTAERPAQQPLPDGPVQHPKADRAYALGLLSFVGALFVLPVLLGPYAWYLGLRTRREIDRDPARWKGRGQATAGAWLGAAASALLGLLVAVVVVVAVWRQVRLGLDTGYG